MALLRTSRPRRWLPSLAIAGAVTGSAFLISPGAVERITAFPVNEHAKATLDLALNATLCHRAAVQSSRFLPARYLTEHPRDLHLSRRELIARSGLTLDEYCRTLTEPVTNNENSLMLMEAAMWWLQPDASVATIGRALAWVRIACVLMFAAACLSAGVSVALVWLAVCTAMSILRIVAPTEYNEYPFLLVLPMVWAALCIVVFRLMRGGAPARVGVLAFALGLFGGFAANLRSSYVPMLLLHATIVFALAARVWVERRGPREALKTAVVGMVLFAAGVALFSVAVMRPLVHPAGATTTNYTYHAIAHSLVLGLAVPDNPLSRSEGIRWDDMAGRAIALRTRPGVAYLGPEYEQVLFQYYADLWRRHPRQMLATYWLKMRRTGDGVFLAAAELVPDWPLVARVYRVWVYRMNGVGLIASAAAITALAAWGLWRRTTPLALLATLLASAALLVLLESAVIYSDFLPMYHSFILFGIVMAPATALQVVYDVMAARFGRPGQRSNVPRARATSSAA